ncbi:MAG: hemolysin family protein [Planctomycetes bacterium]|nr:hemolysin family protein [Planctomycetota bacterium]
MGLVELIVIVAMLGFNSLFAAYELALASVKLDRLRLLARQGKRGARTAVIMKGRMEGSLALVQLGMTLSGAIAAATGGANAAEAITPWLIHRFELSHQVAYILAMMMFVVPLSAITIVLGELVPKVFAIKNPVKVCLALSPIMRVFAVMAFPAVMFFEHVTKFVMRLMDPHFDRFPADSLQEGLNELRAQVHLLRAIQVIGTQEEQIILQASRLSTLHVGQIMLPADDIVMLHADGPLTENLVLAHLDLHTRFPVTETPGDPQRIIGYINFKELVLLAKTHPHNPSLREIIRPLPSLNVDLIVSEALRQMVAEHVHLALVRDKEGKILGMLTQEDVFEELVGSIEDEFDRMPRHITPSGKQWVVGGGATLGKLRQAMARPSLCAGRDDGTTVDDWLNAGREHRLRGGDTVEYEGVTVTVRKVRRGKITEAVIDTGLRGGEATQPQTPPGVETTDPVITRVSP